MSTNEVAQLFNVHPGTIRRWCDQGKIKSHRSSPKGNRKFRREDVIVAYIVSSIQSILKYRKRSSLY